MAYMRDSTGRRLDGFEVLDRPTADSRYSRGSLAPLYGYLSSLSLAKSARCNILMMGDSIMEGFGAATVYDRWADLAQAKLRAEFNPTGVAGGEWVPARYATGPSGTLLFPSWTYTGTTSDISYGPGFKSKQLNSGATATITRTCSSFKLLFRLVAAGHTVNIAIDGGAPTALTITAVSQVWSSPALTPGSHTVVVTSTSGTPALCAGWFFNGDENAGVGFIDGSRSGATALSFEGNNDWKNHLVSLNVGLVVIGVGTNDCRTSSGGYSSATFKTKLESLVSLARTAKPNVPILFMPPYKPLGTLIEPWTNYTGAMAQVVAATPYSALYDMSLSIPDLTSDPYSLLLDGVHPTNRGHALLRDLAVTAMSPR